MLLVLVVFISCKNDDLSRESLEKTEIESAGVNCDFGGEKKLFGIDDNGNGVLDDVEIDKTVYVCSEPDDVKGEVIVKEIKVEGDLHLSGDIDVEEFKNSKVTVITGELYITDVSTIDLKAFSNVTKVGALFVQDCENLTSLSGLEKLTSINGDVSFYNNPALASLFGLENLELIGGGLDIENSGLTTLSGLNNLASIGNGLGLYENTVLTSLSGLENLKSVKGSVGLSGNVMLRDYCAISSMEFEGGFSASDNNYNPDSFNEIKATCGE